ncbi:hypothetical protein HF086_001444 [Spodoptera exigua]|uniref:Reverse transcriptase RNase H-like domain-containing protein n=1 Tax=Spodoptera exigua TaxID=7107 RepID=A0A922MFK5_SPOEX|nr:hypothetical protein HF086_001444 [Spodoptera exigua]
MPPPMHFLTTDASDIAWGARLDNLSLSGLWSEAEKDLHCNQKEMIAILRVLEDHCQLLKHKTILIQSDNKSVVAYLRHEGGTKSAPLLDLTCKVFQIIEQYQMHMKVFHIPVKFKRPSKTCLKSIALQKSVPHGKPPIWNINDLANFLDSKRIDENNIFQVQRHTATLLLLCSGRRIHDLTLLRVDSNNYSNQDDVVIFGRFWIEN